MDHMSSILQCRGQLESKREVDLSKGSFCVWNKQERKDVASILRNWCTYRQWAQYKVPWIVTVSPGILLWHTEIKALALPLTSDQDFSNFLFWPQEFPLLAFPIQMCYMSSTSITWLRWAASTWFCALPLLCDLAQFTWPLWESVLLPVKRRWDEISPSALSPGTYNDFFYWVSIMYQTWHRSEQNSVPLLMDIVPDSAWLMCSCKKYLA